ncbi:MAG: shikimate dehydrogenase [Candidatus Margulisbacteria bacterium]|nr:shikimate dehydrogenase [Candidatus Margulisiibacteriota bacterium]
MPKLLGIIGYPLGHTLSPAMHNAAFKALGLDFEYLSFEVAPPNLSAAINDLRARQIVGFNITVPHKETIIPLLDDVTKLAKIIGAVNTATLQDGQLIGYNTDGEGFIASLKEDAKESPAEKRVVVLGAGGASRAVCVMLAENKAKNIAIADIDGKKAEALANYVGSLFKTTVSFVPPNSPVLQTMLNAADILINTTPIGLHPNEERSPLENNIKLHPGLLVYDLVYNPSETKLLKDAKAAGCRTCSGLGMLVRQGALAFTIWTGKEAPIAVMRQAAEQELLR